MQTVRSPIPLRRLILSRKKYNATPDGTCDSSPDTTASPPLDAEVPATISELLIPRVLIPASNYATLSFIDIAYRTILPLFFNTPVELGGLGLPPPTIGYILSISGIISGLAQFFFFAHIHNRFGTKNVFIMGLMSAVPTFILFPVLNLWARERGVGTGLWVLAATQMIISMGLAFCWGETFCLMQALLLYILTIISIPGCAFIFISASSPNRASLGVTNGLAQMMTSITRTMGPAMANSLFSLSIKYHLLNGWLVYWVLLAFTIASLAFSTKLPKKVWRN